jgi:hypothetical protein
MNRTQLSSLALATLLAACGGTGGAGSTGPGTPLDIAGSWSLSGNMTNATLAASCATVGSATIAQSGGAIGGTASRIDSCTIGSAHPADTVAATIDSGQVTGATASFKITACRYVGAITGSPTDQMGGSMTCVLTFSGMPDTLVGTWHASR